MTIYDVARKAGVSPSTVSRAFSRPGRVSAETAARIRSVAEDLGYRAKPLHQACRDQKSSTVVVVLPDVTNPVYFGLIRGIEEAAAAAGYGVMLADTRWSEAQERAVLDRALVGFDGVISAGSRLSDRSLRAAASRCPTVMLNRIVPGTRSANYDIAAGVSAALRHLADLGHRSVTYVAGPAESWADGMRWRAVLETAPQLGVKLYRVGPYMPTVPGGAAAAEAVRRHLPSAVLLFNDMLAIGLLGGLASAGIQVPGEVSVVGFGNMFGADFCSPPLTTVAAPMRGLGAAAFRQLEHAMRRAPMNAQDVVTLPARLVVRRSTGPARGRRVLVSTRSRGADPASAGRELRPAAVARSS
ncbi:LacI family DNA-binding transcriptional regulator [Nocardia carnea]|uniref:LacI family DNA-binding transcriptional regulator n=1 Tax=Nocardia carnea TaxID=37328 RepID=UPI002454F184|nr:LacI family DNA-binding transcriptional regulator [Nocardia carnea]